MEGYPALTAHARFQSKLFLEDYILGKVTTQWTHPARRCYYKQYFDLVELGAHPTVIDWCVPRCSRYTVVGLGLFRSTSNMNNFSSALHSTTPVLLHLRFCTLYDS